MRVAFILMLLGVLNSVWSAQDPCPLHAGRQVLDSLDLLGSKLSLLEIRLQKIRQAGLADFVVVTWPRSVDTSGPDVAQRIFAQCDIGGPWRDNGIMIFVSPQEGFWMLQKGKGVDSLFPESERERVGALMGDMSDWPKGIENATKAIETMLRGDSTFDPLRPPGTYVVTVNGITTYHSKAELYQRLESPLYILLALLVFPFFVYLARLVLNIERLRVRDMRWNADLLQILDYGKRKWNVYVTLPMVGFMAFWGWLGIYTAFPLLYTVLDEIGFLVLLLTWCRLQWDLFRQEVYAHPRIDGSAERLGCRPDLLCTNEQELEKIGVAKFMFWSDRGVVLKERLRYQAPSTYGYVHCVNCTERTMKLTSQSSRDMIYTCLICGETKVCTQPEASESTDSGE